MTPEELSDWRTKLKKGDLVAFHNLVVRITERFPTHTDRWPPYVEHRLQLEQMEEDRQSPNNYTSLGPTPGWGLVAVSKHYASDRDVSPLPPGLEDEWRLSRELGFNPHRFGGGHGWRRAKQFKRGDLVMSRIRVSNTGGRVKSVLIPARVVRVERDFLRCNRNRGYVVIRYLDPDEGRGEIYDDPDDVRHMTDEEAKPWRIEQALGFNPSVGSNGARVNWRDLKPGDLVLFDPCSIEEPSWRACFGDEPFVISIGWSDESEEPDFDMPEPYTAPAIPIVNIGFTPKTGNLAGNEEQLAVHRDYADKLVFERLDDTEWRLAKELGF